MKDLRQIQKELLEYLNDEYMHITKIRNVHFPVEDMIGHVPTLERYMRYYGFMDHIKSMRFRISCKQDSLVHLDGASNRYSFNIPIINYEGSQIDYYDPSPETKLTSQLPDYLMEEAIKAMNNIVGPPPPNFFSIDNPETMTLNGSVAVDIPHIINTEMIHHINISRFFGNRHMLLIRLNQDWDQDEFVEEFEDEIEEVKEA